MLPPMPIEPGTQETIVNVIKERPELLRNINIAVARVLDEAGIAQGELTPEEIIQLLASLIDDSNEE